MRRNRLSNSKVLARGELVTSKSSLSDWLVAEQGAGHLRDAAAHLPMASAYRG